MVLKPIVDDSLSIPLSSSEYMKFTFLGKMCYQTTMKNHAYILFFLSDSTLFYYHFLLWECSVVSKETEQPLVDNIFIIELPTFCKRLRALQTDGENKRVKQPLTFPRIFFFGDFNYLKCFYSSSSYWFHAHIL